MLMVRAIGTALIAAATLAFMSPQAQASTTLVRTSAFAYDSSSGLLTKEIIEPGDSNLCLVTTYNYDSYGNKNGSTTRNCNASSGEAAAPSGAAVISSRSSSTAYASGSVTISSTSYSYASGQFVTTATNALSQSETRVPDPRFGGVITLTGPNSLATTWAYDTFGRKSSETRADGTVVTWTYTACGTCPTNGKYYVTQTSVNSSTTVAPSTTTYYDSLNREIRTETQGFDAYFAQRDR